MRRLILIFCGCLLAACGGPMRAAGFQAGMAVRVVTPDPLLPVSGGMGPSHATTRKEGELTVRALVLADDATRVAIVSVDFLGFPSLLADRVRQQVQGIPPGNILIGATHTHSAPDCYGFPNGGGGFDCDLKYLNWVCQRAAEAINEANRQVRPAIVKIATGRAKGKIAYNYYAEQLYDPRCHVIQVLEKNGAPFATLVNYAIHPEVLGSDVGICSPDLVGPLYDRLRERGAGIGLFLNSAQGGMVTADNRVPGGGDARTWAECLRIGRLLADEAIRIAADAPVQENPKLFCAAKKIAFPIDSAAMRKVLEISPLKYPPLVNDRIETQLNVVQVGNAQILTIPGEALPNIGFYLKRKMRGEHNLLFGLTNDGFGYLLTEVDWGSFERYDYITRTSLGEQTGEIYIAEALRFIGECPAPPKLPKP